MWKKKKYEYQLRKLKKCKKVKKKKFFKAGNTVGESVNKKVKIKKRQISFNAPTKFSIIKNSNETCKFFREITDTLKETSTKNVIIFINLYDVEYMTTDAIMYLLAIICNVKNATERNISFKGNQPRHKEPNYLLQQSGFFKYVHSAATKFNHSENNIQIKSGQNVDNETVKELTDFINMNCSTNRKFTLDIYDVIIELMNNTIQHAYDKNEILSERNWYLYAVDKNNKIKIVFLDTGLGIAETVHRDWGEIIKDTWRKDDGYYVESALRGEFRSKTKQKYRGTGLPAVYEYAKRIEIDRFQIHTGKAICKISKNGEMYSREVDQSLYGVLYYWEIKKENIEKEFIND